MTELNGIPADIVTVFDPALELGRPGADQLRGGHRDSRPVVTPRYVLRYAPLVEWTAARIRLLRDVGLCLSQNDFAHVVGFTKRTVGNAERGAHPASLALRRALDRALEQASDAQRDRFLAAVAAADSPAPGIHGVTPPHRPNLAALHAPPEEIIAYLQEQWHVLVRADNLFGPAHVLQLVHEQIGLIESLLRDAHNGVRTSLLSLGAEYAESAAWLHEDADDQKAAFWTSRSLEWAHAAGDNRLEAWALFRRSQQVVRDGDAARAIGLAQAAQNTDARLPNQMRAALTQQLACGLALDGDEAACQRKLDEALQWVAPEPDLHGDARSGHGAFCTAHYIELQRAECWLRLGRSERAVPTYKVALAGLPAAYNRDRGYGLAQLANALVATSEPEQAASVTSEALSIALGCGSGRTMQRIRVVAASLRPHAKLPSVARVLDELAVASR